MHGHTHRMLGVVAPLIAIAVAACSDGASPTATTPTGDVQLLSVMPSAAATGVSVASPIVLTFSHPMMAGTESRVVLHEASIIGPVVDAEASWSADHTVLTLTPRAPLKPGTTYVIHLAGQMWGTGGGPLDRGSCTRNGGRVVTGGMFGGHGASGMMGDGWRAADGSYGMMFTFTTA